MNFAKILQTFHKDTGVCVRTKFCVIFIQDKTSVRRFLWFVRKKYDKISTKTDTYLVIIAYLNLLDINLLRFIKIIKLFFSFNAVLVILMMAWIMHLWICDESLNLNQLSSKRKGDRKCYFIMWTNWRKYLLTYSYLHKNVTCSLVFILFVYQIFRQIWRKKRKL